MITMPVLVVNILAKNVLLLQIVLVAHHQIIDWILPLVLVVMDFMKMVIIVKAVLILVVIVLQVQLTVLHAKLQKIERIQQHVPVMIHILIMKVLVKLVLILV